MSYSKNKSANLMAQADQKNPMAHLLCLLAKQLIIKPDKTDIQVSVTSIFVNRTEKPTYMPTFFVQRVYMINQVVCLKYDR